MDDREAQFLAAQNARLANLKKSFHNNDSDGNSSVDNIQLQRKTFWSIFKQECASLTSRLDSLHSDNEEETVVNYVTTQQRNAALVKLQDIQVVIRAIHHYTIDSTNNSMKELEEYLPINFKNHPMPEIPLADQRLVNIEIQNLKEMAQTVQNVIFPKEKFRFRRYRALRQQQDNETKNKLIEEPYLEKNGIQNDDDTEKEKENENKTTVSKDSTPSSHLYESFKGMTLTNKTNCNLLVHSDGTIESGPKTDVEQPSRTTPVTSDTSTSFLFRALDNCQIVVKGTFESMHIIDTKHTTLDIMKPIKGPVHVTDCHDAIINIAFCRQLRIHDCTNISFKCHVGSGPIIEGSNKMKFYQRDYNFEKDGETKVQNLYWDVKDFQWLKSLVKSPNFEVIPNDDDKINENNGQHNFSTEGKNSTDIQLNESSDDDEL